MAKSIKETEKELFPFSWDISRMNKNDQLKVDLVPGQCLFIVGANGSGKSALIQRLASELSNKGINLVRYVAHREPWFSEEAVLQDVAKQEEAIKKIKENESNRSLRWSRNQDLIKYRYYFHKLIEMKMSHDAHIDNLLTAAGDDNTKIREARERDEKEDPIRLFNNLLKRGNFFIEFKFDKRINGLNAQDIRSQADFSMKELSDGERSAAMFAATAITVPAGSVILIDEPELHLHKNIIDPFFSGLVDHRKDCIFVFSTHNIDFACTLSQAQVLAIRSCEWTRDLSSSFDVELVGPDSVFLESVKIAILGTRKPVLYVEGDEGSFDTKIYKKLFPDFLVEGKEGNDSVKKSVRVLEKSKEIHHIEAFGLIDRDFNDMNTINEYIKKNIWVLRLYSVEALFYSPVSIEAVAHHHAQEDRNVLISLAIAEAMNTLKESNVAERMACYRASHLAQKEMYPKLPNRKNIKEMGGTISIEIKNPYERELKRFKQLVIANKWDTLITDYPIHRSPAFNRIANTLGTDKDCYEKTLVSLLENDEDLAEKLRQYIVMQPEFIL